MNLTSFPLWLSLYLIFDLASSVRFGGRVVKNGALSVSTVMGCVSVWAYAATCDRYSEALIVTTVGIAAMLLLLALKWDGMTRTGWDVHMVQAVGSLVGYVTWVTVSNDVYEGPVPQVHQLGLAASFCTMALASVFALPIAIYEQRRQKKNSLAGRIEVVVEQCTNLRRTGALRHLRPTGG